MAQLAGYLEREPITVISAGGGDEDVQVTIPAGWDAFWSSIDASGHGLRLTRSDGVTPISYKLASSPAFNKTTRVGVLELSGVPTPAINQAALLWLYYAPNAAPTDGASSFSFGSPLIGHIDLGAPPRQLVFLARPEAPRSTAPVDVVQLPILARESIYIDVSAVLIDSSSPFNGGPDFEEPSTTASVVLDTAGDPVASRIDTSKTRFVLARQGRRRRLMIKYLVTLGDAPAAFTLAPEIVTSDPAGGSRLLSPRIGVRAADTLEPA